VENCEKLLLLARQVSAKAYAPYSGLSVGAALLTVEDKIYCGCNVENISYGLTICAERVAAFTAIAGGSHRFKVIALYADTPEVPTHCGACRQVLYEFSPDLWIVSANAQGRQKIFQLCRLLPDAFAADLGRKE